MCGLDQELLKGVVDEIISLRVDYFTRMVETLSHPPFQDVSRAASFFPGIVGKVKITKRHGRTHPPILTQIHCPDNQGMSRLLDHPS